MDRAPQHPTERPRRLMTGVTLAAVKEHGLDPELKSVRAANYIKTLRRDLLKVAEAAGVEHPGLIRTDDVEILTGQTVGTPLGDVYGYEPEWGMPSDDDQREVAALMADTAPQSRSAPLPHSQQL